MLKLTDYDPYAGYSANDIAELANGLDDITIKELKLFKDKVTTRLRAPILSIAKNIKGSTISVILESLLKDLDNCYNGDSVFLEKYILDNNGPVIKSKYTPNAITMIYSVGSIAMEMKYLFETIGIKQTILLYLLVIHHMA